MTTIRTSQQDMAGNHIADLHHPSALLRRLSYSRPLRVDVRDLVPGDIFYGMAEGSTFFEDEALLEYPQGVTVESTTASENRGAARLKFSGEPYPVEFVVSGYTFDLGSSDEGIIQRAEWWCAPVWASIAIVGPVEYQ